MKNREMNQILKGLQLLEQCAFPIGITFAIIKNKTDLETTLKPYKEAFAKAVEKYGAKDEEGKLMVDKNGNVQIPDTKSFLEEIEKLETIDCSGITLQRVTFEEIMALNINLTPEQLDALLSISDRRE